METKNLLSGYIQFGNLLILGGSMDCGGLETCMSPGGVKLGFWPCGSLECTFQQVGMYSVSTLI